MNLNVIVENEETILDAFKHEILIAAPKVGSPDASGKERVSRVQLVVKEETQSSRTVAWSVNASQFQITCAHRFFVLEKMVELRSFRHG